MFNYYFGTKNDDLTDEIGGRGVGVLWWANDDDDDVEDEDDMRVLLLRGKYLLVSWCLIAASWAAGLVDREAKTILSS